MTGGYEVFIWGEELIREVGGRKNWGEDGHEGWGSWRSYAVEVVLLICNYWNCFFEMFLRSVCVVLKMQYTDLWVDDDIFIHGNSYSSPHSCWLLRVDFDLGISFYSRMRRNVLYTILSRPNYYYYYHVCFVTFDNNDIVYIFIYMHIQNVSKYL